MAQTWLPGLLLRMGVGEGEFPEKVEVGVNLGREQGGRKQDGLCVFLFEERSKMFLVTFTVVWINISP